MLHDLVWLVPYLPFDSPHWLYFWGNQSEQKIKNDLNYWMIKKLKTTFKVIILIFFRMVLKKSCFYIYWWSSPKAGNITKKLQYHKCADIAWKRSLIGICEDTSNDVLPQTFSCPKDIALWKINNSHIFARAATLAVDQEYFTTSQRTIQMQSKSINLINRLKSFINLT